MRMLDQIIQGEVTVLITTPNALKGEQGKFLIWIWRVHDDLVAYMFTEDAGRSKTVPSFLM